MEYFVLKNGEIVEISKDEFEKLRAKPCKEIVNALSPDELESFKRERYAKFLEPLIKHNERQIKEL